MWDPLVEKPPPRTASPTSSHPTDPPSAAESNRPCALPG